MGRYLGPKLFRKEQSRFFEEANIVEDYMAAFGKKPPRRATIGIMNDSDNTKESSVSYAGFIEVYR